MNQKKIYTHGAQISLWVVRPWRLGRTHGASPHHQPPIKQEMNKWSVLKPPLENHNRIHSALVRGVKKKWISIHRLNSASLNRSEPQWLLAWPLGAAPLPLPHNPRFVSGCSSGLNQIKFSLFLPYESIVNESMRYIGNRRFQFSTHPFVCWFIQCGHVLFSFVCCA
jgi:hypothetical protein